MILNLCNRRVHLPFVPFLHLDPPSLVESDPIKSHGKTNIAKLVHCYRARNMLSKQSFCFVWFGFISPQSRGTPAIARTELRLRIHLQILITGC